MTRLKKAVAATVAVGVLFIPGIAAANDKRPTGGDDQRKISTQAATTFDEVKARCTKAIVDRQANLDRISAKIGQSFDPHDAALNTIITTAKSGLIAVRAAIDSNTGDLAALKADCQRIVTDLRIYALRLPQINLVMSIDKFDAAMAKLASLHDQLAAAIASANTAGDPDAAEATELLNTLEATVASATTKIDSIDVDVLLAITPSSYNADKKVLSPYVQSVRSARSDIKKASPLARHIAKLLEPGDDTEQHEG
ncbi:MAG: hypothetical protein ABI658_15765 [Acidimicrobiales bacterium]